MTVICVAETDEDFDELYLIEDKCDTYSRIYMPNTPLYSGPNTYDEKHGPLIITLEGNL